MFILSNETIFVAFAIVTGILSFTDAKEEKEGRRLKSSKSGATNYFNAIPQRLPITTNVKTVSDTGTVDSFKEDCPSETEAIKQCTSGGIRSKPALCMTCIFGQSNFLVTTTNDVLSCREVGGFCGECSDEALLNFYNCGANGNLMLPGMAPPIVDTPVIEPPVAPGITAPVIEPPVPIEETDTTPTTPVIEPPIPIEEPDTTPTTPDIGPPVPASNATFTVPETNITITAEITSFTDPHNFIPGPPPDATYCPFEVASEPIESGATCNTKGYEYLQCYYPGKVCSCYAIQPLFICVER